MIDRTGFYNMLKPPFRDPKPTDEEIERHKAEFAAKQAEAKKRWKELKKGKKT